MVEIEAGHFGATQLLFACGAVMYKIQTGCGGAGAHCGVTVYVLMCLGQWSERQSGL